MVLIKCGCGTNNFYVFGMYGDNMISKYRVFGDTEFIKKTTAKVIEGYCGDCILKICGVNLI